MNEACASPRRGPSKWVLDYPSGVPQWLTWGRRVKVHGTPYRVARVLGNQVTFARELAPCVTSGCSCATSSETAAATTPSAASPCGASARAAGG